MTTAIFIKTYIKDLEWLTHCLESISRFASGFDEVILVADNDCRGLIPQNNCVTKTVFVKSWPNGYIQQQYEKLRAHEHTDADTILFVDSDCVFFRPFCPDDFLVDGKPVLLKTRYELVGDGIVWKKITERTLSFEVSYEYMRRMPLIYRRNTLIALRNAYPQIRYDLFRMMSREFSEFNVIGAFVERYEPNQYQILDTEVDELPPLFCRQFWSWGGITPLVQSEMDSFKPPSPFDDMQGREDIGLVLSDLKLDGVGCEVGVAFGQNAEDILFYSSLKTLILVDPWDYVPGESPVGYGDAIKDWEGCYEYCIQNLEPYKDRIDVRRMTSEQAADQIPDGSLDFVYIDGNHMSPWVDRDLELWYPKVKSGGVFGGHDYHEYKDDTFTCNVKSAVDRFFVGRGYYISVVPGEDPSWYVVKK